MSRPLSRAPIPDSLPLRPLRLVDEPISAVRAVQSGRAGLIFLGVVGLLLAAVGYVGGLTISAWPWTGAPLLIGGMVASFVLGATLVRLGASNPWVRKFEGWRKVSFDWKDRALQSDGEIDEIARALTGEDDPATARRLMWERIERLKMRPSRGRPRGSRTGMDHETWLEKAREVRKLRRQGMTWGNIGLRLGISADAASDWYRSLEAEEPESA